jgi:hypothetical protein
VDINLLQDTFSEMVRGTGTGDEQLSTIEAAMQSTYKALPKNEFGGLTHSGTAYLVHEYFARRYQWHLRGLGSGPNGVQHGMAPLHEATILQDMAPQLVEQLLEARESGHGLSLSDAAAMAATLHSLVRSDVEVLLEKAYALLNLTQTARLDGKGWIQLLLAFSYATSGQLDKPIDVFHRRLKKPSHFMAEFTKNAANIAETLAYQQRGRINPFVPRTFGFEDILDLVDRALREFGQWQDASCTMMKSHLLRLDPNGAGRVPLGVFYEQPDMGAYRFSESADFLVKTGVLDESIPSRPQVLISNYVLGPGNCFSSSTYFQYCCINRCSSLQAGVESFVQASEATPQHLLDAVGNASAAISAELAELAQELPESLIDKLQTVANRHGGTVPLHGRLFAQWLHFGFPTECPYPHVPTSTTNNDAITANDFMISKAADPAEMQRHIDASGGTDSASERTLSQWTDDEVLSLLDQPQSKSSFIRGIVRAVAGLSALVGTVVALFQQSQSAAKGVKLIKELDAMEKVV